MKEIKEILDFKENADYKKLSVDEIVILKNYITNLQEEKDLKRHIKKLNRRIKYLEKEIENKDNYIKELEDIEDNRLIIYLRHIKENEIEYFDYSSTLNNEGLLEYHICIKRKYNKGDE